MKEKQSEHTDNHPTARQRVMFDSMNDGTMAVSFSKNDLDIHADFIPAAPNGQMLDMDAVKIILGKLNVVHGIRWETITEALNEQSESRRIVKNVLVAKGDRPVSEITEYYKINPLLEKKERKYGKEELIDHREHSPFVIVKKGQVLANLIPRKQGSSGVNVHGMELPYETIHREGISGGENTQTNEKNIISDIHGQLIVNKKIISVQPNLVIKGAVDYRTGNIIFPGDVSIEGPVSDGFKIIAGGSLSIKQTLDLTHAFAKDDIQVMGGIIGKGAAIIKSGGDIRTKFIENCRVAARKSIFVDSEIINSSIYALNTVEMGDKGTILGGDIYAVNGLRAGSVGKETGRATRIHCGIDFVVQQEKEKCNNQLMMLAAKLSEIRRLLEISANDPEKKEKTEGALHKLEEKQRTVAEKFSQLAANINVNEAAAIEITGEIIAGTLIEICQFALFVDAPLRNVRFRLDKEGGKLITEPL